MTESENTRHPYLRYGVPAGMLGAFGYESLSLLLNAINDRAILLEAKLNNAPSLTEEVIKNISELAKLDFYGGLTLAILTVGAGFGLLYEIIHKK